MAFPNLGHWVAILEMINRAPLKGDEAEGVSFLKSQISKKIDELRESEQQDEARVKAKGGGA